MNDPLRHAAPFVALTFAIAALCSSSSLSAQPPVPRLWMSPTINALPSSTLIPMIVNGPQSLSPYTVVCDLDSGPVNLFDTHFEIGFSSVWVTAVTGILDGPQLPAFSVPTTPQTVGLTIYAQMFVIDPSAPNGLFAASNGTATTIREAIPLDTVFHPQSGSGFTGTFVQAFTQAIAAPPTPGNVESFAQSLWTRGTGPQPMVYGQPIVAAVVPFDTEIALEFRGAIDNQGSKTTAWSDDPSMANGFEYLQMRATFRASALTGARPILNHVVVPNL